MKRTVALLATALVAGSGFAATNYWDGTTGSWTNTAKWSLGTVPGDTADYAFVTNGTAQITPGAAPSGSIAQTRLGGASGASIDISEDVEFKDIYLGDASGQIGAITQTGGNVVFSGNYTTHIGRHGTGTYNLSGGTLTHNSTSGADSHTFIGVYSGAVGTFNQTGGTFIKNGTVQQNIIVGYANGSQGTVNLSGGQFLHQVGDTFTLGDLDGAQGIMNISGTAQFQLGDGVGSGSSEPSTGWAILQVGDEGYGEINQTGGSLDTLYMKIADSSSTGEGVYTISGGSLDAHRYVYLVNGSKSTMTVEGSGIDHMKMDRFIALAGTTLNLELDAGGITVMEAEGTASDPYHDAVLRGDVTLDTLAGFSANVGDAFNLIWSANNIETNSMTFVDLSGDYEFDWSIVDNVASDGTAGTGKMLVATVIPEPAVLSMVVFLGGAMLWIRRKFMI